MTNATGAAPALAISQDAIKLIVSEEDSGEAYYVRHYTHFEWPEGASGPTIGIGYDCGYSTAAQIAADWAAFVDATTLAAIQGAAGLKEEAAHHFVQAHVGSVTIPWDVAMKQFSQREMPKWIAKVRASLPNCEQLHPDCLGAVVSLAFNRGLSFDAPDSRHAEMRAIKQHMKDKNFAAIPGEFLHMRRLWPQGQDLWNRRTHEAALFSRGLVAMKQAPAVASRALAGIVVMLAAAVGFILAWPAQAQDMDAVTRFITACDHINSADCRRYREGLRRALGGDVD